VKITRDITVTPRVIRYLIMKTGFVLKFPFSFHFFFAFYKYCENNGNFQFLPPKVQPRSNLPPSKLKHFFPTIKRVPTHEYTEKKSHENPIKSIVTQTIIK